MPSDINKILSTLQVPEALVANEPHIKTWINWIVIWNERQQVQDPENQMDEPEYEFLNDLLGKESLSENELYDAADILLHYRYVLEEYAAV